MCRLGIFIAILLVAPGLIAQQQEGTNHFIVDELYTFMHSGPGKNYRIVGSVVAGSSVARTEEEQSNGYIQIKDNRGRTGWVEARFISNEPGIKTRASLLQQQLNQANLQLEQQQSHDSDLAQEVQFLTARNRELDEAQEKLQRKVQQLTQALNANDKAVHMAWLTRGGIIALAGILLGVLITYLPKRKKRQDHWM